jgi:hypothetical protein
MIKPREDQCRRTTSARPGSSQGPCPHPPEAVLAGTLDGALVPPARRAFKMTAFPNQGFALIKAGILRTVKIGRSTPVTASLTEVARYGCRGTATGSSRSPAYPPVVRLSRR